MPRHALKSSEPRPFKRGGLHKLECANRCGGYVYATIAQLETIGYPACACGEPFEPATLDLALALGREDLEIVTDYHRRTTNKEMSQARAVGGMQKQLARRETLSDMDLRAYEEIRAEEREESRERRASGLRRGPVATEPRMTLVRKTRETDEIPF